MLPVEPSPIMHDGWSCASTHYVALLACYMRQDEKGNFNKEIALLAVSPMSQVKRDESASAPNEEDEVLDNDTELTTTKFDAVAHAHFFEKNFSTFLGLGSVG